MATSDAVSTVQLTGHGLGVLEMDCLTGDYAKAEGSREMLLGQRKRDHVHVDAPG